MKNKTTDKDFKIFCKECKRWLKILGLVSWDVDFEHKDTSGAATTGLNVNQHWAVITLNPDLSEYRYYGHKSLKSWAFHEVCHVFLAEYSDLATRREYSESEHDRVEHAVIETLENTLYGQT